MNTGDWLSFIKCQFVNGACPPVHNIELQKENNQNVDSILLRRVLKALDIVSEVKFSNTLSVG